MSTQTDVLWATGNKFFPGWPYETGYDDKNYWIRLYLDTKTIEVHLPLDTPLDEFEERTWKSFKSVKDQYDLDMATEAEKAVANG